jgi:glycerophosphoryl diester phosphodiesterase
MTVAEIKKIPLKLSQTEEPCPTLEEVIQVLNEPEHDGIIFMIEIKEHHRPEEMARRVIALYDKYPWLYKRAYVASFIPQAVYQVRKLQPAIVSMLLVRKNMIATWGSEPLIPQPGIVKLLTPVLDLLIWFCFNSWLPSFLGVGIIGIHDHLISSEYVKYWQSRGYGVNVWTVNNKAQRDYFRSLGASVTTDFVYDK